LTSRAIPLARERRRAYWLPGRPVWTGSGRHAQASSKPPAIAARPWAGPRHNARCYGHLGAPPTRLHSFGMRGQRRRPASRLEHASPTSLRPRLGSHPRGLLRGRAASVRVPRRPFARCLTRRQRVPSPQFRQLTLRQSVSVLTLGQYDTWVNYMVHPAVPGRFS